MARISRLQDALDTLFGKSSGLTAQSLSTMKRETLRAAFKRSAFHCHPDRSASLDAPSEALHRRFLAAQRAFRILIDELDTRKTQSKSVREPSGRDPVPHRKLRLGEFLMHTRRITHSDFTRAMDWQTSSRPRVGEIAASQGFISQGQILEILRDRSRRGHTQTPFAQFAVHRGYFDGLAKLAILSRQRKMQKPIGSFFLENKLMHKKDLDRALIEQKVHNARFAV